jgi:hypothetical protein
LSALAPVLAEHIYDEVGNILKDIGVLQGDTDGDLMLDDNLKRQDMVVMISRLYKEEEKAKNYVGKNVFKDLDSSRKFYIPYITWSKDQGLIAGMEKDKFGFNGYVTVQQFQTVLLRALGYGEEAKDWNSVPEYAKSLGIMKDLDLNPSDKLSRGEMAYMVLNTLNETKKGSLLTLADILDLDIPELFKVNEEISIDKNSVTFKGVVQGTNSLKLNLRPTTSTIKSGAKLISIDLDKKGNFEHTINDLETGSYEYRFETGNKTTQFKSFKIDEIAFDFIEAKADNLKEIHLLFTKPVDTNSALFVSNYQTDAGNIKEVSFRDDDKVIVLTLNGAMTQQKQYEISAFRVKSKDGLEAQVKNIEFETLDDSLPEVSKVSQLGNKGVKVELSEPVKSASSRNFKIDGKSFVGNVKLDKNIITLTYYKSSYNLDEGTHTINISGIEDYAGYKIIDVDEDFEVIKDDEAPEIVDGSATLENVVIEFNEDIDPTSANKKNFYWKAGSSKRYPDNVRFSNNKAYLEFRNNKLQYRENTIYVDNVTDYSGNEMKLSHITVTPVIDRTNPEVLSYKVGEDGKSITVYYSKNVEGRTRSNYSIKDRNDKTVYIRDVKGSDREYTIYLPSPLPVGENTLIIEGVKDTTTLKNEVVPFETTINMEDVEKPKVVTYTGYSNYIMVEFSKEMDMSTITDTNNYYIEFDGKIEYLPNSSLITGSNDNKSFTILLPEKINNKKVSVGDNLTSIEARGLKDVVGNDTSPLLLKLDFDKSSSGKAKAIDYYSSISGKQGVLLDENTIKIKFNIPIIQADEDDFSISGRDIEGVDVDGSHEVTLYLDYKDKTSIEDGKLSIRSSNDMKTYIDTDVEGGKINLVDEVAPRVIYDIDNLYTRGNVIELPFTEDLESEGAALYRRDLEVVREEDGYVLSESDYSTSLKSNDKSIIQISINKRDVSSRYSIRVKGEDSQGSSTYIRDKSGNLLLDSGSYYISDEVRR